MKSHPGTVIKKENVAADGQPKPVGPAGPASPGQAAAAGGQARIIERNDTTATVEVTCSCGRKTLVLCTCAQTPAQE